MLNKIKHFRRFRKISREKPEYWYFPNDNLGYVQIPKVASRSIRAALITRFSGQNAAAFDKERLGEFSEVHSEHISQQDIRKKTPDAFIFSFVRHPYERILSCYKNKVSGPNIQKNIFECHGVSRNDSFDVFVDKICEIPDSEADRHFRSQSWFLMSGSECIADFVGKLESISSDWEVLRQRFDLPEIPHRNATSKTVEVLSNRNKQLIQRRYSDDFINFYSDDY